jgi:hypothetical protein
VISIKLPSFIEMELILNPAHPISSLFSIQDRPSCLLASAKTAEIRVNHFPQWESKK